jgi:predicted DNA-binding WGR domain protein
LDVASEARQTPAMANEDRDEIHLRRVDPSRNMRRYYALFVQPTLFGGASVIRHWGRIGTSGQEMMETFERVEEAEAASIRIERAKRRRGYRDLDPG